MVNYKKSMRNINYLNNRLYKIYLTHSLLIE